WALRWRKSVVHALPVRSPIAGVVVSFDRVLGQAVKAEDALFAVHDLSRPLIRAHVGEHDQGRVRLGQKARVRLRADASFLAEGTVVRNSRVVGGASRTLGVWVELAKPVPLRHRQLARLTLVLDRPSATLAVPRGAVVREGTRAFMYVRGKDGSFERRAVRLGRADDRFIEVNSGLRA